MSREETATPSFACLKTIWDLLKIQYFDLRIYFDLKTK